MFPPTPRIGWDLCTATVCSPFGPNSGPLILGLPILGFCPNSGLFSPILDLGFFVPGHLKAGESGEKQGKPSEIVREVSATACGVHGFYLKMANGVSKMGTSRRAWAVSERCGDTMFANMNVDMGLWCFGATKIWRCKVCRYFFLLGNGYVDFGCEKILTGAQRYRAPQTDWDHQRRCPPFGVNPAGFPSSSLSSLIKLVVDNELRPGAILLHMAGLLSHGGAVGRP